MTRISTKRPGAPFRKARGGATPAVPPTREPAARRPRSHGRLAKAMKKTEEDTILKALRQHDGHNTRTAEYLGISRRILYDKMKAYGLQPLAAGLRTRAGIMGPRAPLRKKAQRRKAK